MAPGPWIRSLPSGRRTTAWQLAGTATVNTETCAALGFDFEAIQEAFAPYCTKVQEITTAESFE